MATMLIADSGSTKTHFTLVSGNGHRNDFYTEGLNPLVHSEEEMRNVILSAFEQLDGSVLPERMFFYGAGYSTEHAMKKLRMIFEQTEFAGITMDLEHDLLGAARSLFQADEGIACILGTGSNSALYNGGVISDNIPALGYVLGDEGGGLDMGRRLLRGIFKRQAPPFIVERFKEAYNLDISAILDRVYGQDRPNKFIASFSYFLSENIDHDYCREMVRSSLMSFLTLNVLAYNRKQVPVGFVGSIAFVFQDLLKELLNELDLNLAAISKDPMDGLVRYHSSN